MCLVSYKENPHFHQSTVLEFLSPDYVPLAKNEGGDFIYGVIGFKNGWFVSYQSQKPEFGGYLSVKENIYGSPTYCPNATRNHKKHLQIYGALPHLVYFDSEETAVKAGFRRCKVCKT